MNSILIFIASIPIITSVNEHEALYPNYYFCKNLKHWAEIAWNSSDDIPGLSEFNGLISQELGMDKNSRISVIALIDNMSARAVSNLQFKTAISYAMLA